MRDPIAFEAFEPADAARAAANEGVVAYLREQASPQPDGTQPPWAVGGYGVPVHPDLVERLADVGTAVEVPLRFLFGVPVLVASNGVVVAAASGMREIRVRLAADQIAPALLAGDGADAGFGDGWSRIAAWPLEIPATEGLPAVAAVVRVATQAAAPTRVRRRKRP